MGALYEFVASNLESPKAPFYLYVTPPKQELKDKSLTMMKAGLAPAANVYLGSKSAEHQLSAKCLSHVVADENLRRLAIGRAKSFESLVILGKSL